MSDWLLPLLPQVLVAGTAMVVLLIKIILPKFAEYTDYVGIVGLVLALGSVALVNEPATVQFLAVDSLGQLGTGLIYTTLLLTLIYSTRFLERFELATTEWTFLLLSSALGLSLMFNTTHLIVMFLGLELSSLAFYVLCGYLRDSKRSLESSIKYFILGSVGSAFFLLGVALVFVTQRSIDASTFTNDSVAFILSFAIVLLALLFKLSLIPLHFWVPDVYEGAPTILTGFMSVAVKIGVVGALIRLSLPVQEIIGLEFPWTTLIGWFAVLTMLGGNLLALVQDSLKRMLAYSSIAHAGYVTLGLVALNELGYTAMLFYLSVYLLMTLLAFGIIGLLNTEEDMYYYSDLKGLSQSHPAIALALAISMISLSGLPPTGGFMGKLLLFQSVVEAGFPALAVIAVLGSVISVAYYFRVIVYSYMHGLKEDETAPTVLADPLVKAAMAVSAALIVYLGVYPTLLHEYIQAIVF